MPDNSSEHLECMKLGSGLKHHIVPSVRMKEHGVVAWLLKGQNEDQRLCVEQYQATSCNAVI